MKFLLDNEGNMIIKTDKGELISKCPTKCQNYRELDKYIEEFFNIELPKQTD